MSECAKRRKMEGKREFEDYAGSRNLGKRGASWKRRSMSILILGNQRQCGISNTKQSESVVKPLRSKYSTKKLPPATDRPTKQDPSSNLEMVKRKNVEGEAYNKQTHQSATTLRAGFLYLHPGCKSAVDFDRHATKGTEEVRRNA